MLYAPCCRVRAGACFLVRLASHAELLGGACAVQTDREEIRKKLEHGEELLARFRHWEPLISECHRPPPVAPPA